MKKLAFLLLVGSLKAMQNEREPLLVSAINAQPDKMSGMAINEKRSCSALLYATLHAPAKTCCPTRHNKRDCLWGLVGACAAGSAVTAAVGCSICSVSSVYCASSPLFETGMNVAMGGVISAVLPTVGMLSLEIERAIHGE